MKKIIFIALALATSVCSFAQKSVVKEAEQALNNDAGYAKVLEIVTPAFENEETRNTAAPWYLAGKAAFKQYADLLGRKQLRMLKTAKDSIAMDVLLIPAYENYAIALPKDSIPNEKGKIKPKYSKKILDDIAGAYIDYFEMGRELYLLGAYQDAYNLWDILFKINGHPAMRKAIEKADRVIADSTLAMAAFNQGIAAWQLEQYPVALKAFNHARELGYKKKEVYDYAISVADLANDDKAVFEIAKEALPIYGEESPDYMGCIVNYYLNVKDYDNALTTIEQAIQSDPENSQYYVIRGVLKDNMEKRAEALEDFRKAVELDPKNAQAQFNYGRAIYLEAFALNDNAPTTQAEYNIYLQEKVVPLFRQAVDILEEAYNLNPDNKEALFYLENLYYNLKDDTMYQDVQSRKNS